MPRIYKHDCRYCGKYYESPAKYYCSVACRNLCPLWKEHMERMQAKVRGRPSPLKGIKRPAHPRSLQALRDYYKTHEVWNKGTKGVMKRNSGSFTSERTKGANNWRWKGEISGQNSRIRNSPEYKAWRMKVFQRDWFRCVICGYRSKKPRDIRADHIKPFSLYPELRFDVDNGRTLCLPCDLKYGWNALRNSNDNFNYHHTRNYYETRIRFRSSIFQVLTPPRQ